MLGSTTVLGSYYLYSMFFDQSYPSAILKMIFHTKFYLFTFFLKDVTRDFFFSPDNNAVKAGGLG